MRTGIRTRQGGFSLIEILLVVVLISIIVAIAVPNLIAATRVARETRAIAHIKTLSNTQNLFFGAAGKFAIPDELFKNNYLADGQFVRNVRGTLASEVISDNYYDYTFSYLSGAAGYTLDCDPKAPLQESYRYFRYRASRLAAGTGGSSDVILVAPPQPGGGSPATTAYKPFNPN